MRLGFHEVRDCVVRVSHPIKECKLVLVYNWREGGSGRASWGGDIWGQWLEEGSCGCGVLEGAPVGTNGRACAA